MGFTEARTLSRLMYCVKVLEQVRGANSGTWPSSFLCCWFHEKSLRIIIAVIDSTLRLIYDELHKMNLRPAIASTSQACYQSQDTQTTPNPPSPPSIWSMPLGSQFIDPLNLEIPLSLPSLVEGSSFEALPATLDFTNFDMTGDIQIPFDLSHGVLF
jgi:hypothetical protein